MIKEQRYGIYHVEQQIGLKGSTSELGAAFMKGDLVVKRKSGSFYAVRAGLALEELSNDHV